MIYRFTILTTKKNINKILISGKILIKDGLYSFPLLHKCKNKVLRKVFNILKIKKYNDVWFDFRLSIKNF